MCIRDRYNPAAVEKDLVSQVTGKYKIYLIISLIIIVILLYLIYRQRKAKKKLKELDVEDKHEEV